MKIAIVHDWLNGMRGGERVLEALLELCPEAPVYTLFHERGRLSAAIASHPVFTSWLDRVPGVYRFYRHMLPLLPAAAGSLNLEGYDLIISSSHAVAKNVHTAGARHISYCHSPMRYIWDAEEDYRPGVLQRLGLAMFRRPLREWDRASAQNVDHFIANSRFVSDRIRRCYGRASTVIHPPVDTGFFTPAASVPRGRFYLAAGALVPYKRTDVIIRAFNRTNKPLVVAGSGPELRRLRRIAGSGIEFTGRVSDAELRHLYRTARGLVFAAREDFGIIPVEAQACGCAVVAFGEGGVRETVTQSVSGVFFGRQTEEDIIRGVEQFESMTWNPDAARANVEGFSREIFKDRIHKFIERSLEGRSTIRDLQPA